MTDDRDEERVGPLRDGEVVLRSTKDQGTIFTLTNRRLILAGDWARPFDPFPIRISAGKRFGVSLLRPGGDWIDMASDRPVPFRVMMFLDEIEDMKVGQEILIGSSLLVRGSGRRERYRSQMSDESVLRILGLRRSLAEWSAAIREAVLHSTGRVLPEFDTTPLYRRRSPLVRSWIVIKMLAILAIPVLFVAAVVANNRTADIQRQQANQPTSISSPLPNGR